MYSKVKLQQYKQTFSNKHPNYYNKYNRKYRKLHQKYFSNYGKNYHEHTKLTVFTYYTKGTLACQCCGETVYEFLTLDHKNNDGVKRRKIEGTSIALYRWIINHKFPKTFQVLCFNCNFGRNVNRNGICPHNNPTNKPL